MAHLVWRWSCDADRLPVVVRIPAAEVSSAARRKTTGGDHKKIHHNEKGDVGSEGLRREACGTCFGHLSFLVFCFSFCRALKS